MIIAETPDDPAAYWGMLLSKFGVEYLEDAQTGAYVPYYSLNTNECIVKDPAFIIISDITEPNVAEFYEREALRIKPLPDIQKDSLTIELMLKLKEQYELLFKHLDIEFQINDNPELLATLRKNIANSQKALKTWDSLDNKKQLEIIECNDLVLNSTTSLEEKIEKLRIKKANTWRKFKKIGLLTLFIAFSIFFTINSILYSVKKFNLLAGSVCSTTQGTITRVKYDAELIKKCIIPNDITKIAPGTFSGCKNLQELVIPPSVKEIGDYAFKGCKKLRTLINSDCQNKRKFRSNVSGLAIPNSVKQIGYHAFYDCGKIESEYGGMWAAKYIIALDCKINKDSFRSSDIVTRCSNSGNEYSIHPLHNDFKIIIDERKNETLKYPFPENCEIKIITNTGYSWKSGKEYPKGDLRVDKCIPIFLSKTGTKYFIDAEKGDAKAQFLLGRDCLENKYLEGATKWLNKSAEQNYLPAIKFLPNIETYSSKLENYKSLGLKLSNDASELIHFNNKSITTFNIPIEVEKIKANAFKECNPSLTITIPSHITSIEEAAFAGVKKVISNNNLFPIDKNGVLIDKRNKILLYVPPTLKEEFQIPQSVTRIGSKAFFNCSSLKTITIPSSVNKVSIEDFHVCKNLKNLIIQNGVKDIYMYTFKPLSIEFIDLPESIKKINVNFWDNIYWHKVNLKKIRLSRKTKISGFFPHTIRVLQY